MELSLEEIRDRVTKGFKNQNFMGFLGAELNKVEPGFVEISLSYLDTLTQQHGFFHGGVVATLADNVGGFAGYSMMSDDEQPLSIEFKINLMTKAEGELLIARGKVIKNGRRIKVCQADVYALSNGVETLCATALVSVYATKEEI